MQVRANWAIAWVLLGLTTCASEEDETLVAVRNSGTANIDVTVSDGASELSFDSVAAGTTSTFQPTTFGALSGLTVSVGTVNSTIALTEGSSNVVDIDPAGKVASVFVPVVSGGEGRGGW